MKVSLAMRQHPGTLMLERSTSLNNTYHLKDHRKSYEKYYGYIPVDADGRTYEIHHIDGNHSNNDPLNLVAITIQEHYDIHYVQGDYGACAYIFARMNKTPQEISKEASRLQRLLVKQGKHQFQSKDFIEKYVKPTNNKRILAGTHNFLNGNGHRSTDIKISCLCCKKVFSLPTFTNHTDIVAKQRISKGTVKGQLAWCCLQCKTHGKGIGNFNRYHGENCGKHNIIVNNITYPSIKQAAKALNLSPHLVKKLLKVA